MIIFYKITIINIQSYIIKLLLFNHFFHKNAMIIIIIINIVMYLYHKGTYLVIAYFLIVPKLAVSKGLLSDATRYNVYEPEPPKFEQTKFPEFTSVVVYERTLKHTGFKPPGPEPVII